MQQRSSTSFRETDDHCTIIFSPAQQDTQGRRSSMDDNADILLLPLSDPCFATQKRAQISRCKLAGKWIHAIPFILLLVFFVLWWFSYPVDLVIKDREIIAVYAHEFLEMPKYIDHVELAVLGESRVQIAASSPLNPTIVGSPHVRLPISKLD